MTVLYQFPNLIYHNFFLFSIIGLLLFCYTYLHWVCLGYNAVMYDELEIMLCLSYSFVIDLYARQML